MGNTNAAMAQLKEFGIPAYAARAYLALLELGVGHARAVSDVASIPSAKVYGALLQLQRRGLVEVAPGKPRTYTPVPMEDFVERSLREQEEHLAELRARKEELAHLFRPKAGSPPPERQHTVTIEGKRNIMQHLREACQEAQRTIHAMMSPALRSELSLRRLFEEASKRGVDLRVVDDAPSAEVVRAALAAFPPSSAPAVREEAVATLVATFDDRAALLVRFGRGRRADARAPAAIATTDAGFVAPLRHLLACHWQQARVDGSAEIGGPTAAVADARIDPRTFDQLVREHATHAPGEVCAILHASDAEELRKERLWDAVRGASRARVLLSPLTPRPADPSIAGGAPPGAEVRFLPRASAVAFAILDGRRAFVVSPSHSSGDRRAGASYGMTVDAAIVRAFEAQFEAHWAAGLPLVGRRRA